MRHHQRGRQKYCGFRVDHRTTFAIYFIDEPTPAKLYVENVAPASHRRAWLPCAIVTRPREAEAPARIK